MNLFDLKGRVAIVTGGNGGIGLGMAEGLAQAGATVMLAGRNAKKAETALATLRKTGSKAEFCEADVTKEAECKTLVAKTVDDIRARRHPDQQCRHQCAQTGRAIDARGMDACDGHQPRPAPSCARRRSIRRCSRPRAARSSISDPCCRFSAPASRAPYGGEQRRRRAIDQGARDPAGRRTTSRPTRSCRAGSKRI